MPDEKSGSGWRDVKRERDMMREFGGLATLGIAFVLAIAIGSVAGYFLDEWLGTRWIKFVGFLLGVAAAIVNVYRTATRYIK
jgi:ATP synthase protein I